MSRSSKLKDYLSLSIKLILILSILNSIYFQLWHILSTNIFLLILMFIPQILKKSIKIVFPREFEFLLLIFVIITLFLGQIGGIVVPIFFGIASGFIGFMILLILYSNNQIKKNYFLILLFSFNFAVAFGFTLEFIKYYLKLLLGHELTLGIYKFSMMTMTYVIIGALISAAIGCIYMQTHLTILNKIFTRFLKANPEIFSKKDSSEEIINLIKKGESAELEFKSTLRVNLHTDEIDKKIEFSLLKAIIAFLNSKGGTLLIGISNSGEILGIKKDKFDNLDKFLLHLSNIIKQHIGKRHLSLINIESIEIKEDAIVKVECKRSTKPIFLKTPEGEEFYIRSGPSSNKISGSELIEYVEKRFKEKP